MKTRTKVWLVIATALVLLGCILFTGVMSKLNWDFKKLSTVEYEKNVHEICEAFDCISIDTNTADIIFAVSDSGNCKVECYEEETLKHFVTVEDNTLVIKMIDSRSWYDYIGVNFGSPKITIYLPVTEGGSLFINGDTSDVEIPNDFMFKDVDISLSTGSVDFCASASELIKIKTSTGDICMENISTGSLELTVTTGKTYLTDIACKSVISSGNTGDISLNNVIATEKFSIERSTGDVKFDGSDATEIFVKTDTGDVTGSLLTDKVFITQTDTGDVNVPKTVDGGRCEMITDTGDIKITIRQ